MCEAILSCCYTQDKTRRQQYVVVHVLSRGEHAKGQGEAVGHDITTVAAAKCMAFLLSYINRPYTDAGHM